jgi:hypothetical protein
MSEALLTSRWGSSAAYLTWKASATKPSHLLFQLAPSMPRTDETEFGLLPTPTTPSGGGERSGDRAGTGDLNYMARKGLLHTPTAAANQMAPSMRDRDAGSWGLWPTPAASQAGESEEFLESLTTSEGHPAKPGQRAYTSKGVHTQVTLNRAVKLWPTPVARDYKGQGMSRERRETREPDNLCSWTKKHEGSGSLNPAWVEWLMGFPEGWTDLKPSEMPLSRKSSSKSGGQ